jgi:hypothetical protein
VTRFLDGAPGTSKWLSATLGSDPATDSWSSPCCHDADFTSYLMGALALSCVAIGVAESNSESKGVFSGLVFDVEDEVNALNLSVSNKCLLVLKTVVGGVFGKLPVMLCSDVVVGASCPVVDGGISTCFGPFLGGIPSGCMPVSAGVSVTPCSRRCSSWHLDKKNFSNFDSGTLGLRKGI